MQRRFYRKTGKQYERLPIQTASRRIIMDFSKKQLNIVTYDLGEGFYMDKVTHQVSDDNPDYTECRFWLYHKDSKVKIEALSLLNTGLKEPIENLAYAYIIENNMLDRFGVEHVEGYKELLAGGEELHNYMMMLPPVKYNLKLVSETDILIGTAYTYKNEYYEIQLAKMYEGELTLACSCLKSHLYQPNIFMMDREIYFNFPSNYFQYEAIDKLSDYLKAAKITVEEIEKKIKSLDKL